MDTGSAGDFISKDCFERLRLVWDNKVEYAITSATNTTKKIRKVLFGDEIAVVKSKKSIPALVLEGFHF